MNKKILALSISTLSIISYADYVIVVNDKNNDFKVGGFVDVVTYGQWTDVGEPYDCKNPDILESDVYFNKDFIQKATCTQKMTTQETTTRTYDNGQTESTSVTVYDYDHDRLSDLNKTGTHLEDNCKDILSFDSTFLNQDGTYNSNIGIIKCNMTTKGGGWTQVANIGSYVSVFESSDWIDNIDSKNGSFALKYFNQYNPEIIMFENGAINDDYGQGDLILVKRKNSSWNWTPADHNNDTSQTGEFFDNTDQSWTDLGDVVYASHRDEPWQSSPFSFTINGMTNGYSGTYYNRLILGGTSISASAAVAYSFYGNPFSMYPDNHDPAEAWRNNNNLSIWMK